MLPIPRVPPPSTPTVPGTWGGSSAKQTWIFLNASELFGPLAVPVTFRPFPHFVSTDNTGSWRVTDGS